MRSTASTARFLYALHAALMIALFVPNLGLRAQQRVAFVAVDSAMVYADLYGKGKYGVVLAHGGRFNKESWSQPAQALAAAGYRVLALDFRGYGASRGPGQDDPLSAPLHLDVLAAVRFLKMEGAQRVAVIGGSMGGGAAANAAQTGEVDGLVLLAPMAVAHPERMRGRKLFITAANDTTASGKPRLIKIREQFEQAPEPKEWMVVPGYAHAQALLASAEGERVLQEILRFLADI